MKLTIATCQFPVDADIRKNMRHFLRQMRIAKKKGAHVAHFPEAGLSGYAGFEFKSYKGFDWDLLKECTQKVIDLAGKLRLWVILGSTHRLSGKHKPHNSLYIINDKGEIVDRYDKMFCAGDKSEKTNDLAHYTPGNHFTIFNIKGVKCGAIICHDYRYPELYREYKRKGIQVMFHSYNAAHIPIKTFREMQNYVGKKNHKLNRGTTIPEITMIATMHSYAANSYVWISCSNASARESCWASFFVRPDGVITGCLRLNTAGVLISTVDTQKKMV